MSCLSFCIPTCPLIQCSLAESTSCPSSQVTDEGTGKYQPQYQPPRSTTRHWCLGRQWNGSHCPLSSIIWPLFMSLLVHLSIPYPSYPATKSPCMTQNVESSAKITTGCPPVLQSYTLQHRGNQVNHQWPALLPPLALSLIRWTLLQDIICVSRKHRRCGTPFSVGKDMQRDKFAPCLTKGFKDMKTFHLSEGI